MLLTLPWLTPPLLRTGSIQRDRGELPGPLPVTGGSPATWAANAPCTVLRSKARYPEGAARELREHTLLCPVAWYTRGRRWDSFPLVVIVVVVVVVVIVLPSTLKHVQHALERLGLSKLSIRDLLWHAAARTLESRNGQITIRCTATLHPTVSSQISLLFPWTVRGKSAARTRRVSTSTVTQGHLKLPRSTRELLRTTWCMT